jgi:hypothetical protein
MPDQCCVLRRLKGLSKKYLIRSPRALVNEIYCFYYCVDCGAEGPKGKKDREEALSLWNKISREKSEK